MSATRQDILDAVKKTFDKEGINEKSLVKAVGLVMNYVGSGGAIVFNGDRLIKSVPSVGQNLGTTTLTEFIESAYFGFIPATINLSTTTLYESGSTQNVNLSITITPNDETTISNRDTIDITGGSTTIDDDNGSNSYSVIANGITANNTWRAQCDVDNNGSPTTISDDVSIEFIRPWIYGMNNSIITDPTTLYTDFGRSLQKQGNKTFPLNGTNQYIHILIPDNWADINKIIDQNGFDVTGAFTQSTNNVTTSGLTPGLTSSYKKYVSGLTTVASANFQIQF